MLILWKAKEVKSTVKYNRLITLQHGHFRRVRRMKNGGVWRRLAGSLSGTRQIYLCGAVRENPEKGCCWVSEGKRPRRIVNNIPDGWIGVEEDLPEPGKLNENTLDYQKYMCLVQVVEGKSADARPLAFTENRRWVNGNVDMTDYVLAWQDIPKCRNEKVVLPI